MIGLDEKSGAHKVKGFIFWANLMVIHPIFIKQFHTKKNIYIYQYLGTINVCAKIHSNLPWWTD